MVTRPTSFCDVMLAKENRPVIAHKKRDIIIPGIANPDGKPIKRTYDVSPEGEKVLDQLISKMNKAFQAAPRELMDLHAKVEAGQDNLNGLTARREK